MLREVQAPPLKILDLCSGLGSWSEPYARAGYEVVRYDISDGHDVRLIREADLYDVHGILAAPPCTHLANSGARWWSTKGENALLEALSVVDACLRIIYVARPNFWALENPLGRLNNYLGKPKLLMQPWHYGDPYTKLTCVWGDFKMPAQQPVDPWLGSWHHYFLGQGNQGRATARSETPPGFAQAFFEANK